MYPESIYEHFDCNYLMPYSTRQVYLMCVYSTASKFEIEGGRRSGHLLCQAQHVTYTVYSRIHSTRRKCEQVLLRISSLKTDNNLFSDMCVVHGAGVLVASTC